MFHKAKQSSALQLGVQLKLFFCGSGGENANDLSFLLNISLHRNEICNPEQITSFITHHIPDAKLKTKNKEKLVYTLPLERTNIFPGNSTMITIHEIWEKMFTLLL